MDKDLTIFENEEFGKLTVIERNNKPWFIGREVAGYLGYTDTAQAIKKHCKYMELLKNVETTFLEIPPRGLQIINEKDVYRLIMRSKLPSAEKFQDWVMDEVLPTIRKTGGYMVEHPEDTPEEIMARALKIADYTLKRREERLNQLEAKIELDAPKVEFAEAVEATESSIDVSAFANVLGIEQLGRNKLYAWFRTKGYLRENKEPYRKYIERGYFDVVEVPVNRPFFKSINIKPLITPKGQVYFTKKLKDCFTV